MNQRRIRIALVVCVILFIAALLISNVFSEEEMAAETETYSEPIVLSEVLSGNSRYPAPNGAYLDFVEVRNLSGEPVNISGYMLSDAEDSIDTHSPQELS